MRSLLRSLLSAVVVAAAFACSTTPALELSVTPKSIAGDGVSPVTVTVKLTKGGAPSEGTVHLTTSGGSFKESGGGGDPTVVDVTVSDGTGTAIILPPRKGRGTLDVKATASLEGAALTQSKSVALTPAGGLANTISFSCARQNIGALVSGRSEAIHVQCTAVAKNVNNQVIPNASIETMAEAGRLQWVTNPDDGVQNLIYTVDVGASPPKDVEPLDASGKPTSTCAPACQTDPNAAGCVEPCWVGGGVTHNPRDGVATLMVAVPGVKAFDDKGEPFVDADDDGARGPSEAYIDVNGNGKYDVADGTQHERMVWAALRIVWSGEADTSPTSHGSKITKVGGTGTTATMQLRLNDSNFNSLAADGTAGADAVQVSSSACNNGGSITVAPAALKLNQITPGIKFDPITGDISGPGFPSTYRNGSDYSFTATVDAAGNTCDLEATLSRTYDPGAPGFPSTGELSSESIAGSIAF